MKANQNMNVKQLKEVVRFHKLNKPHIKLGMKKADLIAGLKKEGHWKEVAKVKKTTKAPVKKAPVKKKAPAKKKKITFDDLYDGMGSPAMNYINDMTDEDADVSMTFAQARKLVKKYLVVYNKQATNPTISGALSYIMDEEAKK